MKITVTGMSFRGIAKYPRFSSLNIVTTEEDFLEEACTLFCSPSLEERDKFLIWCDKRDCVAIAEELEK